MRFSPVGFKIYPFESKKEYPRADAQPIPPSVVAEPPIKRFTFELPFYMESKISWPVPNVLVSIGFLYDYEIRDNPDALAISI